MITAGIAAIIVWSSISLLERKNDNPLDGWTAFILVLVPALITWLVTLIVSVFDLPQWIITVAALSYIAIPMLILKSGFEMSTKKAIGYSCICLFSVIVVETLFLILLGSQT